MTPARIVRLACVVIPLVFAMTLACASSQDPGSSVQPPRVTVTQGELQLDGQPWWPTGLNAYQLATDWQINAGCGAEVDLDAYFSSLPDGALTRFNAFQGFAVSTHTGELDLSALDAVFAAAERHGQVVVPVLAGQDGACEDEQYKDRDWYTHRWEQPTDMPLSYRDWVATAVARWSGSPAVAAWEPLGEPEAAVCASPDCLDIERTCPSDSAQVLREWTDEVGALIRSRDPDHLITAGVLGGDQCGLAGDGYALLADSPHVDVLQFHDYDDAGFLPMRLAQTDKPLVVTEVGIQAGSCLALGERAELIGVRLDRYRSMGAAGALLWAFVPDPRPTECTYDIGPEDPVMDLPQMRRR